MATGRAASAAAARSRHAVLSLTTKFRLPHEGMAEMEYLSRGSAFLLDTTNGVNKRAQERRGLAVLGSDLVVLTCQHVACPWLFPRYFADKWDWLQHVSEEFVQHSLQLLELPTVQVISSIDQQQQTKSQQELFVPRVLEEIPLQRHVWLHPSRDLAMLSLSESLAEVDWDKYTVGGNDGKWDLELLTLLDPAKSCASGDVVLFTGHKQFSDNNSASQEDQDLAIEAAINGVGQFPKEVLGRFVGESSQGQAFAWSEEILEEGMCGGAVVNTEGDCVGLIEGIVPPFVEPTGASVAVVSSTASIEEQEVVSAAAAAAKMHKALENHVAFIPSKEIAVFLLEKGEQLQTGTLLGLDEGEDDLW